jgi:hypothetical protein
LIFFICSIGNIHPKLLNVAAWQLPNQLGSKILLRHPFVLGRREAGVHCHNILHSPISVGQLPEKSAGR